MAPPQRSHGPLLRGALLLTTCSQLLGGMARAAEANDVMRLLDQRACVSCQLQDADLVHADLRKVDLSKAQLQRANLSRAQLDGANLQGADLTFTSLLGASLRGADLRGAQLEGTDLRQADLSGALLDVDGLARSHWKGAVGVKPTASNYADLHNSGVEAALQGRAREAETYFNQAIAKQPSSALSWLARGISRAEQNKRDLAAADFTYAAALFEQQGNSAVARQIRQGAKDLKKNPEANTAGNGWGGQLIQASAAVFQQLAPLAIKYFAPLAF